MLEQFIAENPDLNLPLIMTMGGIALILFLIKAMALKQDMEGESRQNQTKVSFPNNNVRPKPASQVKKPVVSNQSKSFVQQHQNKPKSTPPMDDQTKANIRKLNSMKGQMTNDEFQRILKQTGLDKFFE